MQNELIQECFQIESTQQQNRGPKKKYVSQE